MKIKSLKVKQVNGEYGNPVALGADAENIDTHKKQFDNIQELNLDDTLEIGAYLDIDGQQQSQSVLSKQSMVLTVADVANTTNVENPTEKPVSVQLANAMLVEATTGFHFLGSIESIASLNTLTRKTVGDTYYVVNENAQYTYIGGDQWKISSKAPEQEVFVSLSEPVGMRGIWFNEKEDDYFNVMDEEDKKEIDNKLQSFEQILNNLDLTIKNGKLYLTVNGTPVGYGVELTLLQ